MRLPVLLLGTLVLAHLADPLWYDKYICISGVFTLETMVLHGQEKKKKKTTNKKSAFQWIKPDIVACSASSLWMDPAISICWQFCPHPTSNSESRMHVHGQECSCVQSLKETLRAAAGGQAGVPFCDVTANNGKWVEIFAGADQQLPEEKRSWFALSAVLLFLKWIEFVITASSPHPLLLSIALQSKQQNPCWVSHAIHHMTEHAHTHNPSYK